MKFFFSKGILIGLAAVVFISCKKENIAAELNEPSPVNGGMIIHSAGFLSDQRSIGGIVRYVVNGGKRYLVFENFSAAADKGLRVYLSPDLTNRFVQDLGPLKAFRGNFSYELPGGFDPLRNNNILIWQRTFANLYGHATF
jgi:hypothetical protein